MVHLLETTLIRVGNDDYARQNNSYGLTTLKTRHVAVDVNEVRFGSRAEAASSGRCASEIGASPRSSGRVRSFPARSYCSQYLDDEGNPQDVTSSDVNAYLKEITGQDITPRFFYLDGNLVVEIKSAVENELRDELGGLKPEEAAVLAVLRGRLARDRATQPAPAVRPSGTGRGTGDAIGWCTSEWRFASWTTRPKS